MTRSFDDLVGDDTAVEARDEARDEACERALFAARAAVLPVPRLDVADVFARAERRGLAARAAGVLGHVDPRRPSLPAWASLAASAIALLGGLAGSPRIQLVVGAPAHSGDDDVEAAAAADPDAPRCADPGASSGDICAAPSSPPLASLASLASIASIASNTSSATSLGPDPIAVARIDAAALCSGASRPQSPACEDDVTSTFGRP